MPENKLLHCGRVFQLNSRNIVGHFRLLERKKGKNKLGDITQGNSKATN